MQIQKLSFADMMAKYVEKPALPTFTSSNVSNLVENSALPTIKRSSIMAYEPSYTSYTNVVDTSSKGTNWLKIIVIGVILGGVALLLYRNKEKIKKWYAENFKNQYEEDDLTLNN